MIVELQKKQFFYSKHLICFKASKHKACRSFQPTFCPLAPLFLFFDENPNAIIYAKGSTKSRTRLYRMGISKYIHEIADDFQVFGERNGLWEEFQVNIDYYSFVIKRKSLKFD